MVDVAGLQKLLDDEGARREAALRVQQAYDFTLPTLQGWNYAPCRKHRVWEEDGVRHENEPKPMCRQCGVIFRRHQRVGIPWLFLSKKALLADFVGSGKTVHAAGLFALMQEVGEFDMRRALVCVGRPSAILQWQSELQRMLPRLMIQTAVGSPNKRIEKYLHPWDVMLIGPQMLMNDWKHLRRFPLNSLVVDDLDPLRNRGNKTAHEIRKIGTGLDRVVIMSATPLQKKLHELYNILEVIGGDRDLGTITAFEHFYVNYERVTVFDDVKGTSSLQEKFMGYKNLDRFKRLVAPYALRRTPDDIDDVTIPRINPVNHWLDLYEGQRRTYNDLRKGVLRVLKSDEFGNMTMIQKQAAAMARMHYAAAICDGLGTVGGEDGPGASVKLDWVVDKLTGDLDEEKVVIFVLYKPTIRHLHARLQRAGVGFETIWGEQRSPVKRMEAQERFWDDPECRVMIGTTAIEQSLNLQCARHLINVGQIMNPARMLQLAGRIARDGSKYKRVFVHNLRCGNTHEEAYLRKLEREQALADHIWEEESQLFDKISPYEMLQLIGQT